ncbi:hypothetical protein L1049_005251 [Liquidambar formosana]|uniref:Uncharacterized protein n=1 Tax=Liquidambar formosana TaxID=63359 RepID=A0AAP0WXI5_LIQFO
MGMSEFNNYDPKNPFKTLPQELVPMPFKPMNIAGGMLSSSSGTLFGGPRNISSSSSSLQLSSNGSSGFSYLQDSKSGSSQISGSAHMSATALLQKAAQMGATASNGINSPMMQKSYVTSMAGSDQISGMRPSSYGTMQQLNNSYDHFQSQPDHQSNFVGINGEGFANQLFDTGTGSSPMNDMGMFNSIFMGGDQNNGMIKGLEHEDGTSPNLIQGKTAMERTPTGPSRFGRSSGGNHMETVDFLGIGGSRQANLHELQQHHHHHQQQQQRLGFEANSQQRLQVINPFQQHLSHGESAMENPYGKFE